MKSWFLSLFILFASPLLAQAAGEEPDHQPNYEWGEAADPYPAADLRAVAGAAYREPSPMYSLNALLRSMAGTARCRWGAASSRPVSRAGGRSNRIGHPPRVNAEAPSWGIRYLDTSSNTHGKILKTSPMAGHPSR